jgi:DNA-binding NarL/FixJ family response regulator
LLTPRELEVLNLLKQHCYTDKGIAQHLGISKETVHRHFENISIKLKLDDKDGTVNKRVQLYHYTP